MKEIVKIIFNLIVDVLLCSYVNMALARGFTNACISLGLTELTSCLITLPIVFIVTWRLTKILTSEGIRRYEIK